MVRRCAPCSGSRKLWPERSAGAIQCSGAISLHHAAPEGVLAQHELDQLGARGEGGQPEAAAVGRQRAARDRPAGDRARCGARPSGATATQPMAPALGDAGSRRPTAQTPKAYSRPRAASRASPVCSDRGRPARPLAPRSIRSCVQRAQSWRREPSVTASDPSAWRRSRSRHGRARRRHRVQRRPSAGPPTMRTSSPAERDREAAVRAARRAR